MNRFELLALLRKNYGFKDEKPTLESVKAYTDANGIEFVKGGKAVDIEKAWSTKASATIATSDVDVEVEDKPSRKSAEQDILSKSKTVRTEGAPAVHGTSVKAKAYDARAIQGKTAFECADAMTQFNAAYRLKAAELNRFDYAQKANDLDIVGKDGTELVNSLGGALVYTMFQNQMIYLTEPYGAARKVANVVNMSGGGSLYPRKTGIVDMTHMSQGATIASGDNTYDNIELVPKQCGVLIKTNRNLWLNSAINVQDDIAKSIVEAQLKREDKDYFLADQTAAYGAQQGLVSALPSGAYINGSGNAFSAITMADFDAIEGSVENVDPARCTYIMSRQAFARVCKRLAYAAGGNSTGDFIEAQYIPNTNEGTFRGTRVIFSQVLPTVSASGAVVCYYGDFASASMLGDRLKLEVTPSEHAGFSANQIWTRGLSEFCVNIHGDGRASTYGPIVCLKTT
jgi:HK97 family phage major capsid protein